MLHLTKISNELIQCIFAFLTTSDILLVRLICKYFSYGAHNRIFWRRHFEFLHILKNSQKITDFKSWNPSEKDKYVTEIELSNREDKNIHRKMLNNLHHFPNLIYVNMRDNYRLLPNTLECLSTVKSLMFLDIYDTTISEDLTSDKVKQFLNACPNLIEVDLSHVAGFSFKLLNTKDSIAYKINMTDPGTVDVNAYPYVKTWGKCRYAITKIKSYMILSKVEQYFKT